MKLEKARFENFKKFKDIELSFCNKVLDEPGDEILLLGDNGSGKTTILQGIGLCLALASGTIKDESQFDFYGWLPKTYYNQGQPIITLSIQFDQEEIEATRAVAKKWQEIYQKEDFVLPGSDSRIEVVLEGSRIRRLSKEQLFQFRSRYYARGIIKKSLNYLPGLFDCLPTVYWSDQYRNLSSWKSDDSSRDFLLDGQRKSNKGIDELREFFANHWASELFVKIEKIFQMIFPERRFEKKVPMIDPKTGAVTNKSWIILNDSSNTYEIGEMSGGEQAILPVIVDILKLQLNHSILLIDEIDQNLHPPLAQAMIQVIRTAAPHSQIIYTTHNRSVVAMSNENQIIRLPSKRLSL